MPAITRRDALRTAAVLGAGAVVGCSKYPGPRPVKPVPDGWMRGEERWITTVCGQCPAGCGVRVRVVDGCAVKIEGNPAHPLNQGGVGPKGQSGLQMLYHPDRIPGPLRRTGERGAGGWAPVGWDEAIHAIAQRLAALRSGGRPERLVVVDGQPRGGRRALWSRFCAAYGTPNHIGHKTAGDTGAALAMTYMHGVTDLPAYDWSETQYVLGFGASLYESWCQTIHFIRAASHLRRGTPGHRVKLVQVSPRFAATAAKSDEWVPIAPGTYGALALGIAHVLVAESLYDATFVRDHTFGFAEWSGADGTKHRGFRDLVLKDYPPERVAELTGTPAEEIQRIAREMAAHRPAVAVADEEAVSATNGLGTAMAVHALNGLLGNLERPGGLLTQRAAPLTPWPAVKPDATAVAGRRAARVDGVDSPACALGRDRVQALPDAILAGTPYPVEALFLHYSNPVFAKPGGRRWIEALRRVPLVVSFSPLADESTQFADFVLPDHTYLERWEAVDPVPSSRQTVVGLRRPVVAPVHDTLATSDVVLRLAKALKGSVAAACPWADFREATLAQLEGLVDAEGGSLEEPDVDTLAAAMGRLGAWSGPARGFEQWAEAFRTPSGRFEFYSQTIAARLAEYFPTPDALDRFLAAAGVTAPADEVCPPHWQPPAWVGAPADYPFVLMPYRGMNYAEGGSRHLPALRELPLAGRWAEYECVEVHPEDAARLELLDGDPVWIESPAGRRRVRATLSEGTRPGTVVLPLGRGPWPGTVEGDEPPGGYALLAAQEDVLAGMRALQGTRVRLRKEQA